VEDFEMASKVEQEDRERCVASVLAQLKPQNHPHFNGTDCVECGDKIPAPRLKAGRIRCTGCQGAIETRSRQFATARSG
jgi:RNA polymerase-binding transcription factor DksA